MFRKEVVKALIDEGFCVTISAPPRESKMSDYFKDIGCHVENIQIDRRGTNPLKDLIQIWHYLQLIRKVKPSAVLTYTIKPNVYGGIISRLYRVPQIDNITGLGVSHREFGMVASVRYHDVSFWTEKLKKGILPEPVNIRFLQ